MQMDHKGDPSGGHCGCEISDDPSIVILGFVNDQA